jgi:hypothetical protein
MHAYGCSSEVAHGAALAQPPVAVKLVKQDGTPAAERIAVEERVQNEVLGRLNPQYTRRMQIDGITHGAALAQAPVAVKLVKQDGTLAAVQIAKFMYRIQGWRFELKV